MNGGGYSTIMDAILFLALVAVSTGIMSPTITGHATERSVADRGLGELAAGTLTVLESQRVDFFEYRVLGDVADKIAGAGGVNATSDILYRDVTNAVLGRGQRHRTAMDIAAGDAACQFLVGAGAVRLNPLTAEYDGAATALIDEAVRARLDSRYGYEFTLRWAPLAGVPFGGEARAGRPRPPGAVSSSAIVTMPYATDITPATLERANAGDLDALAQTLDAFGRDADRDRLRRDVRRICERCYRNTTGLIVDEIWGNTLGSASAESRLSPGSVLARFSGNATPDGQWLDPIDDAGKDLVAGLAVAGNADALDRLAGDIAAGKADGRMDADGARGLLLEWLESRYAPSRAVATVSIWVEPYA